MGRLQLSALVNDASGNCGPIIVARGRGGPVVRQRPVYKRHQSDDQLAQEARLKAVAAQWSLLSTAQAQAWDEYARGTRRRNTVSGGTYTSSGYNVYSALSLVLVRLDPGRALPTRPPQAGFAGDRPGFEVSAEPGALVFAATGPNAPGIVTELMVQRLPTPRRRPTRRYKSAAFTRFTPETLVQDLPAEPAAYACATRFIQASTGLTTLTQTYGIVLVE